MSAQFTYYDILGVDSTASAEQIKAAYRSAVLKYHPDVNSAPNAQRLTTMLNDAYSVLSDIDARHAYDQSLQQNSVPSGPQASASENWELFVCDGCGKIDANLRFAMFFKVWSLIVFTRMAGAGGVLCSSCRSSFATRTAIFSLLFGPWGLPWGPIYTLRSLLAATRGGEKKRVENGQLLRHLGVAFLQRGLLSASRTALSSSLKFEKNSMVKELLESSTFTDAAIISTPKWIRGQTVGLSFLVLVIAAVSIFVVSLVSEDNLEQTNMNVSTQASSTPFPQQASATMPPCFKPENESSGSKLYNECKSTRENILASLASSQNKEDKDYYTVLNAIAEIDQAIGARRAHFDDAQKLATEAIYVFRVEKDAAKDYKTKAIAKRYYDCNTVGRCNE